MLGVQEAATLILRFFVILVLDGRFAIRDRAEVIFANSDVSQAGVPLIVETNSGGPTKCRFVITWFVLL